MKSTLEHQYMLSVPHSQYYIYLCTVDFRSQWSAGMVLSIDPQSRNILSPASKELMSLGHISWHVKTGMQIISLGINSNSPIDCYTAIVMTENAFQNHIFKKISPETTEKL